MKYSVPTYTTVPAKSSLVKALDKRTGSFQRAFEEALDVGLPVAFKATKSNGTHDPDIWKDAVAFAQRVCEIMRVDSDASLVPVRDSVIQWFGRSVFINKKEYVIKYGVWYERTWKEITAPKPKTDRGVMYWRDDFAQMKLTKDGIPTAKSTTGISLATVDKKGVVTQTLTEAKRFEEKSKKINVERRAYLENKWNAKKASESRERFAQIRIIYDQRVRDRTEMINKAIKQMLGLSHLVTFMAPITQNDAQYFALHGIKQMADTLSLIGIQTRNETVPFELHYYDARLLRPLYDKADTNKHSYVAAQLLPAMKPQAAARSPSKKKL